MLQRNPGMRRPHHAENSAMKITNLHILMRDRRIGHAGDRVTLHHGRDSPGVPYTSGTNPLPGPFAVACTAWALRRTVDRTAPCRSRANRKGYGMQRYPLYIDSRQVEAGSGQWFESYNPYTGEPWAQIAQGDAADV